ncbi:MAG: EAL domain-containing protein, partial [Thermoanaerobaculia bacterium]
LDMMAPTREGSPDWPEVMAIPLLEQVLTDGSLGTAFQPIVRLATRERLGYEALARCSTESPMRNPEILFRYAQRKHRVADLEAACGGCALQAAATLPGALPIFMNTHPEAFGVGSQFYDSIVKAAEAAGIGFNRLVLEITEQASLGDARKALETIGRLKQLGVRFAFDDLGVAYSHLPFMDAVRPAFLKISQHFGTGFESDPTKTKIVRNVLALANDFDCALILEGIETEETAQAAVDAGIHFGQGYLFGRPAPASDWTATPSAE